MALLTIISYSLLSCIYCCNAASVSILRAFCTLFSSDRAKLDKLIVNADTKEIKHFDYKTTGGSISRFEETFESYRYYRQFAHYHKAIEYYIKDVFDTNGTIEEWKIQHYVVVVETYETFCSSIFPVTQFWLNEGLEELVILNKILDIHYLHDNWKQTYLEILNNGINKFRDARKYEPWY